MFQQLLGVVCPLRNIYHYASYIWPGALPEKKQIVLSELSVNSCCAALPRYMFQISFDTYPLVNGENKKIPLEF